MRYIRYLWQVLLYHVTLCVCVVMVTLMGRIKGIGGDDKEVIMLLDGVRPQSAFGTAPQHPANGFAPGP